METIQGKADLVDAWIDYCLFRYLPDNICCFSDVSLSCPFFCLMQMAKYRLIRLGQLTSKALPFSTFSDSLPSCTTCKLDYFRRIGQTDNNRMCSGGVASPSEKCQWKGQEQLFCILISCIFILQPPSPSVTFIHPWSNSIHQSPQNKMTRKKEREKGKIKPNKQPTSA